MTKDVDIWMAETARATLDRIGVGEGQVVVDYGCGPGYTAIPAAMLVGRSGRVYAVEKSRLDIARIRRAMKAFGTDNVSPINTHGKPNLPLEDDAVDIVLAFDVLLPYYFGGGELKQVVRELHRVCKPLGTLAVYPSHVSIEAIRPVILDAGFTSGDRLTVPILHNGRIRRDDIFTFQPGLTPASGRRSSR